MNHLIRGVILDVDGTLIDSNDAYAGDLQALLAIAGAADLLAHFEASPLVGPG